MNEVKSEKIRAPKKRDYHAEYMRRIANGYQRPASITLPREKDGLNERRAKERAVGVRERMAKIVGGWRGQRCIAARAPRNYIPITAK